MLEYEKLKLELTIVNECYDEGSITAEECLTLVKNIESDFLRLQKKRKRRKQEAF
jgi:ribosomal protein L40E